MKRILEEIEIIRHDTSNGASTLARNSIMIMKSAILASQATTIAGFSRDLEGIATKLYNARPSMSPVQNLVKCFMADFALLSQNTCLLSELQENSVLIADKLIVQFDDAGSKTISNGVKSLLPYNTIITCSYSSTVCKTLILIQESNPALTVICFDSYKSGNDIIYGEITCHKLSRAGINCKIIDNNIINDILLQASACLIGADSVFNDGTVINGYPSFKLAKAVHKHSTPFYSICDTFKFNRDTTNFTLESGFDSIPSEYITGLITEYGVIAPEQLPLYF